MVRNPITGVDYVWPKAKQKIATTDQRRVSTQVIPGADGVQSQYGLNPFPRGETQVTISFRVTPRQKGTTFDALRNALNLAVDHGLPQELSFLDDNNVLWYATGWLVAKNLEANEDQQWFADWSVTYLLEDPLAYGKQPGFNAWGQPGLKWGQPGLKWGNLATTYALTSSSQQYTIANPLATADTTDMIFNFSGQWGPVDAAVADGSGFFAVQNTSIVDLNTGAPITFWVVDNMHTGEKYQIDCGSSGTYKGATPVIGTLRKDIRQYGHMRFRPGDNVLSFVVSGSALSPATGSVTIGWKPKKSLS
jgi:hypothetical protein